MNRNDILKHHGILGQKWGVRRYQNEDGTLTDRGKSRRRSDYSKLGKDDRKKYKTYEEYESGTADQINSKVNDWVKKDIRNAKDLTRESKDLMTNLNNADNTALYIQKENKKRLDLSGKTDQELRAEINRELLERQYNEVFNQPKVSKGRKIAKQTLKVAGDAMAIAGSLAGIALTIKELTS